MEKLFGWYLRKHITSIVNIPLRPDSFTSWSKTDATLQIDNGTENEITVHDGFVEIAGLVEFFLKLKKKIIFEICEKF